MDKTGRMEHEGIGHVFRWDNGDVLRRALDFKVTGRRGRGQSDKMWKKEKGHTDQIGLKKEDAIDRTKWRDGVYKLPRSLG